MIEFDKKCVEILNDIDNCHSRNAFRSALNHLDKAEALFGIDQEMCVFRAVTAEEEAATGIMLGLKERGYKLSNKLKHRDHVHKSALFPFINIIHLAFVNIHQGQDVNVGLKIIKEDGARYLRIFRYISLIDKYAFPIPPLNFEVNVNGSPISFDKEIDEYLDDKRADDIVKYVKHLANLRNKLLYASSEGYPNIEIKRGFVETKREKVMIMLKTYLLIQPYKEHQIFVQKSVYCFLKMLKIIDQEFDVNN